MNDFDNATVDMISQRDRPNAGSGNGDTQHGIKNTVGRTLETAAGRLREKAEEAHQRGSGFARFGTETANSLDRAASYVRDADAQKVRQDIEETVRQNPGKTLIIAGVAGLLLGSLLRRR